MRSIRQCLSLTAVLALGVPPGLAQAQVPTTAELREAFRVTDLSGDGRIDREEFHRRTVDVFFLRDKGKKGYLVIEEIQGVSPAAFKAANRKGDGKLTLQEWTNARFVDFVAADVDKDGTLTFEEVEVYTRSGG
jgi:Ca2+-binding EF-hand superfamily protein